jgi:hypothetical protein
MKAHKIFAPIVIFAISSAAFAESGSLDQRNACRPDVRRFCYKLKESDGEAAFLGCLKAHLAVLSKPCRAVLESDSH